MVCEPLKKYMHKALIICGFFSWLFQEDSDPPVNESLSIENTLWASTVIASGKAWCVNFPGSMLAIFFKKNLFVIENNHLLSMEIRGWDEVFHLC